MKKLSYMLLVFALSTKLVYGAAHEESTHTFVEQDQHDNLSVENSTRAINNLTFRLKEKLQEHVKSGEGLTPDEVKKLTQQVNYLWYHMAHPLSNQVSHLKNLLTADRVEDAKRVVSQKIVGASDKDRAEALQNLEFHKQMEDYYASKS